MKNRIMAIIMSGIMAFSLFGCGGIDVSSDKAVEAPEAEAVAETTEEKTET